MKKDRNCGAVPYPIYPMPIQPIQPNMQLYPSQYPTTNNNLEQQVNSLVNQVSNLERRVSTLESLVGTPTQTYNNSNFQML